MFRGTMISMTREKNILIQNCDAKMRQAEIQAEKDSIAAIDEYKKHEKHQCRLIDRLMKDNGNDIDLTTYEEDLEDKVEKLKTDLLDIEIKLGEALRTAYGQFESKLKNIKQKMVEVTGAFAEEAVSEAQTFARNVKQHGIDSSESLKNHFDLLPEER